MKPSPPLIVICGPTAVGKSETAVWLAEHLQGEIISADSQQVYRELNIGTAKPEAAILSRVPHFGFDLVNPNQVFDASKFQNYAEEKIAEIFTRQHQPLVVGGTGLYLRVLQYGLFEAPARDHEFRAQLLSRIQAEGVTILYQELQTQDPQYAAEIHCHDQTRIIRALEILQSGVKPSELFAQHAAQAPLHQMIKIGLNRDRAELYTTINQRVEKMLQAGWLEEVKTLRAKYGDSLQAYKAVGYTELIEHLQGKLSLSEAISLIQQRTRNYAKRQLTWFRQDAEISWFEPHEQKKILEHIAVILNRR